MKISLTIFALPLVLFLSLEVYSQPSATALPRTSSIVFSQPPSLRIAVIDTEAFHNPEAGIVRMRQAMKALEEEFASRNKDLREMQSQYIRLANEIEDPKAVLDDKTLQQKKFEAETLKRNLKNLAEDVEVAYKKRLAQIFPPIVEDIEKALASFATERGIIHVFDLSNSQNIILYASPTADITKEDQSARRTPVQ